MSSVLTVQNLSFTTIAFADELLNNFGHELFDTWVNLTDDQKQQMLNMAAMQLQIGYCLCEKIKELDPIPLQLQQANVWQMADMYGTGAFGGQSILKGATSIQVDVLRVSRQALLTNDSQNPFSDLVDSLMRSLGFEFCGRGNMSFHLYRSRG